MEHPPLKNLSFFPCVGVPRGFPPQAAQDYCAVPRQELSITGHWDPPSVLRPGGVGVGLPRFFFGKTWGDHLRNRCDFKICGKKQSE